MKKILIVTLFLAASLVMPRSHAQTNELDHKTFFEHTKTKAGQGDVQAQALLGACYANGEGVARNPVEAVKWYRKAAEQNNALAQNALGFSYASGQGVAKDSAAAVKWYRMAAEQNHSLAQFSLGLCYHLGKGLDKNYAEAVKWYRKAAEQDIPEAQYGLGVCYDEGVTKDVVEEYARANLAAKTDTSAVANRDHLEKRMSSSQLAAGKKRSEELQAEIEAKLRRSGK